MGLIRAGLNAVGGTLASQWKEYFYADALPEDVLATRALKKTKGLFGGRLVTRHVLRNALIPIVTVLAPLIVDLLTGALVVEKIYGINGIGKLMVDAIAGEGVDYNYVLALGILYSSLYIGVMLIVDILYGALDPRIRVSAKGGVKE